MTSEITIPLTEQQPNGSGSNNNHNNNNNNSNDWNETIIVRGNMDADMKKILLKIGLDVLILMLVGWPILFFYLWGDPYKRGFFCDDESLMHPFHESTVKNYMLYIIGLVVPTCLMIAIEKGHKANPDEQRLCIFDWDIPIWIKNSYKQIGVFGFGAACSQLTTDIAKYSIGRLRPHFFHVCQPLINGLNCSHPSNMGKYIEVFECAGIGSNPRMIKEMRLSFPSGHSSFSAYTMVYCVLFLQARLTWRGSKLYKHFIQFLLLMMTWYTALSRISDYKHHWSDVLSGALLGSTIAIIVAYGVSDLFTYRKKLLPANNQARYELNSTNNRRA